MTGQPPNKMSQSPERGRRCCSRSRSATNGRLAGAAAMLTHGVTAHRRTTIGIPAYLPATRIQGSIIARPGVKPCYSRAVKSFSFSGANQAMQLTAPRSVSPLSVATTSNLQPHALSGAVADLVSR